MEPFKAQVLPYRYMDPLGSDVPMGPYLEVRGTKQVGLMIGLIWLVIGFIVQRI